MSDSRREVCTLLRAELAAEVAAGFPRLRRIPQTDIIWFLDYFAGLAEAEREALLDALAEAALIAFFPRAPELVKPAPALTRMCEARNLPGAKGGTRYMDLKTLGMSPSLQEPGGYHPSWRDHLTELHFQPRADLLPALSDLKAAKAPLVRKLVNAALTKTLGLQKEKKPGGVIKYTGRCGDCELAMHVDFGAGLHQLGYTAILKSAGDQSLIAFLCYEQLWAAPGRWDYLTEENAPRCIDYFAEQVAYLANLGERIHHRIGAGS